MSTPPLGTGRYVRFVVTEVDGDSKRPKGVLVAAHELRDAADLSAQHQARLEGLCRWFDTHLRIPRVLSEEGQGRALSWFKPGARKPIARTWELVHLLRELGLVVDLLRTKDPGSVVYEDKWQLVAKPPRRRPTG